MQNETRLLLKLAILSVPFICGVVLFFSVAESPSGLQERAFEHKLDALIGTSSPQIIIAGDSRAEFNVVPELIKQQTGLSTVNVAVGYGTLEQIYREFKTRNLLSAGRIIIISISSYEINDSVISQHKDDWEVFHDKPLGLAKIQHLLALSHAHLLFYSDHFKKFLRGQDINEERLNDTIVAAGGYVSNSGVYSPPLPGSPKKEEPWYSDVQIGGIKERSFMQAIENFSQEKDTVVMYVGPIAPSWRRSLEVSDAKRIEQNFIDLVAEAIRGHENLHLLDFRREDVSGLTDRQFNDEIHMNENGARIFTQHLVEVLQQKMILPR